MNTNLLALVEFTKKFEALVNEAKAIGLNPEMSAHICALDPNFSNNVSQLMEMLSTTTPETTTTNTNKLVDELLKRVLTDQYQPQTPEKCTADPIPIDKLDRELLDGLFANRPQTPDTTEETTETEATNEETRTTDTPEVLTTEETSTETLDYTSEWKKHPSIEGLELSTSGEARVNGEPIKTVMTNGYARCYNRITRKQFQLATEMLVTFMGPAPKGAAPVYKDGDRTNCAINNLYWGRRDPSLSTSQVERACKLIAENPTLSENELVNMLVAARTIRSSVAFRSILKGNYKTISDRYFLVRGGSIIPRSTTTATTTTPTPETTSASEDNNLKGILGLSKDPGLVKNLVTEKINSGEHITRNDIEALVLAYLMDGCNNSEKIQKGIRKDFGRRLMISNTEITKLIGKGVK
jgi:hypothetical protein